MAWQIEFDDAAKKDLAKLDKQSARRLIYFFRERFAVLDPASTLSAPALGLKRRDQSIATKFLNLL